MVIRKISDRWTRLNTFVEQLERRSGLVPQVERAREPVFDLEAAYDEAFEQFQKRRDGLRAVPGPERDPLQGVPDLGAVPGWASVEKLAGTWDYARGANPEGDPLLKGMSAQELAEMVLVLLNDRATQKPAPAAQGGAAPNEASPAKAESAPAASASPESAPAAKESAPAASASASASPASASPASASPASAAASVPEAYAPAENATAPGAATPAAGTAAPATPAASAASSAPTASALEALQAAAGPDAGFGQIDELAPEEYAKFRADPSNQNFNALVAKIAGDTYQDITTALEQAQSDLRDPAALAAFAADPALEAYDLQQVLTHAGNIDYAFAELPDGVYGFVNDLYMSRLREQYPGITVAEQNTLDISKMTRDQFLTLPEDRKTKMLSVLEKFDPESAQAGLARALRFFERAEIDGGNFDAARTAAIEKYSTLTTFHPELIALLQDDSPFASELLANAPAHSFKFTGAGFESSVNPYELNAYCRDKIRNQTPDALLRSLDHSVVEMNQALAEIRRIPSFENLAFIATEVIRRIGADAAFFEGLPEGADYKRASDRANELAGIAERNHRMKELGMYALGGATALLGLAGPVGAAFRVGTGVALAVAAGVTGLGFAGLEVNQLMERNFAARFNVPGYADVNGQTKPTAGEWALALLDGLAAGADLAFLPRAFGAAVKTKLLAQSGLEAANLAKLSEHLRYFDDLDGVTRLTRVLTRSDRAAKTKLANAFTALEHSEMVNLGKVLDDAAETKKLTTLIEGLDQPSVERTLRELAEADTGRGRDVLDLLSRFKAQSPAAANKILSSPDGLTKLRELRAIGSDYLTEALISHTEADVMLDGILELRGKMRTNNIDSDALIRNISDFDPRMMFGLVRTPSGGANYLSELGQAVALADSRGLDTSFARNFFQTGVNGKPDVLVLGPATIMRGPSGMVMRATNSSEVYNAVKLAVTSVDRGTYDYSSMRGYLTPPDNYQATTQWSPQFGNYDGHYNVNRPIVEDLNRWIRSEVGVVRYVDSSNNLRSVRVYGSFTPQEMDNLRATLAEAARVNPKLIEGLDEVQWMENIGHNTYPNDPSWYNYAAIFDRQKKQIIIDPAFARNPDTLRHELAHNFAANTGTFAPGQKNPFIDMPNVGFFSDYGRTNPEENFCEAYRVIMRNEDVVRRDPQAYVDRLPVELKDKAAWVLKVVFGIAVVVGGDVPPEAPPDRTGPTPY